VASGDVTTAHVSADLGLFGVPGVSVGSCYGSELVDSVHPRSYDYVDALARMRGGYAGMRYAEAFAVVREGLT
jgi:hypothetical protein